MDRRLQQLHVVLRALADPTRLRILGLLSGGEVCVCHIHDALRIPQPKASRHLAYLRRAGLVATRRDGLWVHYRLGQPSDPTARTVLNAAVHTLGHVPTVQTDEKRMTGKGVRPPAHPRVLPTRPCCAPR